MSQERTPPPRGPLDWSAFLAPENAAELRPFARTVTAHPDDIATVWPTGTPGALQTKASTGQGKDVRRARSQLAARGYVPVLLCGQQVERQRQRVRASASPGAGHPVTHRRRRHWRNQAHGPGRSLRKLVWVMPMLVGHHQSGAPESGHLYRMSPEDS